MRFLEIRLIDDLPRSRSPNTWYVPVRDVVLRRPPPQTEEKARQEAVDWWSTCQPHKQANRQTNTEHFDNFLAKLDEHLSTLTGTNKDVYVFLD